MDQILSADNLLKEAVTAITVLHKNTNVMIHSPDASTEFFDIAAVIL